jgi:hypothetical protein
VIDSAIVLEGHRHRHQNSFDILCARHNDSFQESGKLFAQPISHSEKDFYLFSAAARSRECFSLWPVLPKGGRKKRT